MNTPLYKIFNNLFIGIFLIGGWLGIHAKSTDEFLDTVNSGSSYQLIPTEDEFPEGVPFSPIHADSEEETVEEDLDDSDSSDKGSFSSFVFQFNSASKLIESNKRQLLTELPRYMLFHCWKYNCL